jgi:hypothetical protein
MMEHLQSWIIGGTGIVLLGLAVKYAPEFLASQEDRLLTGLLDRGDDADDELLLAIVKWADKKIPGGQQGHLKYQAAANLISARFPLLSADKLDELIEKAVDRMKAKAEERVAKGAGAPPAR